MPLPKMPENIKIFAKEFPNFHKIFLNLNVAPCNNKTRVHVIFKFIIKLILIKLNLCYFAHFLNLYFLRPATLAFGRSRDGSRDDDGICRAPKIQLFATHCGSSNGDPDVDDQFAFDSARESSMSSFLPIHGRGGRV